MSDRFTFKVSIATMSRAPARAGIGGTRIPRKVGAAKKGSRPMTCLRSGCPLYLYGWGIPASRFPVHITWGLEQNAIRSGGVIIYAASHQGRSRLHLLICNLS